MQDSKTSSHPTSWRWDEDGSSVRGTYVRMDEAATDYGRKAIVVLTVAGEERSVWLFETALVSKFQDEIAKRSAGDFTLGERIEIDRGTEKVPSGNGRGYWPYRVAFPDAPRRNAGDILGVRGGTPELVPDAVEAPAETDDIPFHNIVGRRFGQQHPHHSDRWATP